MANGIEFSEEQWQLLVDTPALVGASLMVCSRSGAIGTIKEAAALTRGLLDVPSSLEDNKLVQAIVNYRSTGGPQATDWQERYQGGTVEELEREVLSRCEEVERLLRDFSDAETAMGCKRWIFGVGLKVAKAASEGGFLGFGGERISAEEERLLVEIGRALDVQPANE